MIQGLLNVTVQVYRRVSTGVDSLNNPVYGLPTQGTGWIIAYPSMPCRLAFTDRKVEFVTEGERVLPYGTLYYGPEYSLVQEDRVFTPDGIEYVLTSIRVAYKTGSIVDHYEGILQLP